MKLKIRMDSRKKKKVLMISGLSLLGIILIATTIYGLNRIPPNFDKLSDEKILEYAMSGKPATLDSARLAKLGERLEKIPPEKRRESMQNLAPEQRNNFRENGRLIAEARLKKTIDEFFSLPPDKQNEFLDRQIEQMEARRREFAERFGRGGGFPGRQGGGGAGFPMAPGGGGERRQNVEGQSGTPGSGRGEFQPGVRGQGRQRMTPDARLQRGRDRLSETSPEDRAKRREYFRRLMERRRAAGAGRRG